MQVIETSKASNYKCPMKFSAGIASSGYCDGKYCMWWTFSTKEDTYSIRQVEDTTRGYCGK